MPLALIHSRLALTAVIYSAVVGLWALFIYFRKRDIDSNFWGALVINELIFVAQAVFGVILIIEGLRPGRTVHYLYGALGLITLPSAFAFTRGRSTFREALIYGVICLFLAGVAIRAIGTATGG